MSPEAESLLHELIEKKDSEGQVMGADSRTLPFQELEENDMFSQVHKFHGGGSYVRLSSRALNYFADKEAASKEKQEKREDMVSKRQAWIMSIISGIIVGVVVTLINQLFK